MCPVKFWVEWGGDCLTNHLWIIALHTLKLAVEGDVYFFHTHLWFPASDQDFWQFGSDFQSFCKVITEKNIVEEIDWIMGPRCRSWFLEYKLSRVNSILHERPWWILYIHANCHGWLRTGILLPILIQWTISYAHFPPDFIQHVLSHSHLTFHKTLNIAHGGSLQNRIRNLPDRSTILPKFIYMYGKEGKPAGPTPVLLVRVHGLALILKTAILQYIFTYMISMCYYKDSYRWITAWKM